MTLGRGQLLSPESACWTSVLERVPHDVYHTPEYHLLPGFGQQGEPFAFVYEEGNSAFLWPYLLAPIAGTNGYHDVTSVYGYPGPVASGDPEFLARAWLSLQDHWRMQRVVSAFTRFHPLLANSSLLRGIPNAESGIRAYGPTVAIDLSLPVDAQHRQYNKTLRQGIRKAREAGFFTLEDSEWLHIDDFVGVYHETMSRRGSRPEYLVDRCWVERLRAKLGAHARLFVTKFGDRVAAAMIVLKYKPFVHSHLLGSALEFSEYSPSKVLLDDVRIWGSQPGYTSMHLGGGLGGREDALFDFKRRFSPVHQPFHTGNWIIDESAYGELNTRHRAKLAAQGLNLGEVAFFPAYRYTPHIPADQ